MHRKRVRFQIANECLDVVNLFHVNSCVCLVHDQGWVISYSVPYQINEIWDLVAKIHFLNYSLPISLKYDLWLLWAISFTIPYQNHWNMTPGWSGPFPSQCLIKSMKYETWLLRAISFTIPYQHHWNMTYNCYGPFPLQFLIEIIEIWHLATRGNFHYYSLSKSLKSELWLLWAISYTIPYQNHWNMTPGC